MSQVLLLEYHPLKAEPNPQSTPGKEPFELCRAKRLRNQIMMLREESQRIHRIAIDILQEKWKIDDRIRLMMREQENLTKIYFYTNGLIKVQKPKTKSTELESMLEELELDPNEALGLLKGALNDE